MPSGGRLLLSAKSETGGGQEELGITIKDEGCGIPPAELDSLFQPFHGPGHGRINVRIPKGATASDIADILDRDGVIANSTLFRIRLDLSGNSDEQATQVRDAIRMIFPEAVTLVREAREGLA